MVPSGIGVEVCFVVVDGVVVVVSLDVAVAVVVAGDVLLSIDYVVSCMVCSVFIICS